MDRSAERITRSGRGPRGGYELMSQDGSSLVASDDPSEVLRGIELTTLFKLLDVQSVETNAVTSQAEVGAAADATSRRKQTTKLASVSITSSFAQSLASAAID